MKLNNFFQTYSRQITIVFFVLFMFKSFQSCNRQSTIDYQSAEHRKQKDSLTLVIQTNIDTIKSLKSQLDLAIVYKEAANIRAEAVQSVAEKITKNTTVKVEK